MRPTCIENGIADTSGLNSKGGLNLEWSLQQNFTVFSYYIFSESYDGEYEVI